MQAGRQRDEDASSSVSAEAGLFWGYRSARTMNGIEPQSTRLDAAASWRVSLTGQCHHLPKFVWVSTWYYIVSYGRGIRKGTQGSVLAWRTASLLLIRLLFVLKPPL